MFVFLRGGFSIHCHSADEKLELELIQTQMKQKRLMLSWVHEPRIAGGQEMTYGRSLERHLKYFGLVDALAQDRAGWLKLVTKAPFSIGKPQLRPPRCDTRVTPEEKRSFLARRTQETEKRRALFNAETDAETT